MPPESGGHQAGPSPIFILSMPRSGSTLLQRILSTHPSIATVGEPHFLVPLLYALRQEGVYAEYNHPFTVGAIEDFLAHLPGGEQAYRQAVANLAGELYSLAATGDETYFVDKAPRYALIAEELLETFPDATFILLWRNPLAVAASLLETYHGGAWRLHRADDHLYLGLPRLLDVAGNYADRVYTLRYEDLVADPKGTIGAVAALLGLEASDFDLVGAPSTELRGSVGDKMGVVKYDTISRSGVDAWTKTFANPLRRAWARGYLESIGEKNLAMMGYDSVDLLAALGSGGSSRRRLGSDAALMTYSSLHRRLDPPVWRAKTQDSLWRYIDAMSGPLRRLLRGKRPKTNRQRDRRRTESRTQGD